MATPEARLTDLFAGVCVCHPIPIPMTGVIITGSSNVNTNELSSARLTDIVLGACGHVGTIVGASGNVNINELGAARLGDPVAGCLVGTIVSGSGNVNVN